MKHIFLLFLFFCFFSLKPFALYSQQTRGSLPETSASAGNNGTVYALIVGVSDYAHLDDDLQYAHSDALLMYETITAFENVDTSNVILLLDEKATVRTVDESIRRLLNKVKKDDLIYFYFAGHGDTDKLLIKKPTAYLLTHETKTDGSYTAGGAVSVSVLKLYTDEVILRGAKPIIILDACRSGFFISSEQNTSNTLTALNLSWNNSAKFVACQPDELSRESDEWGGGHGVFTYYLAKGIAGAADKSGDKHIWAGEIGSYTGNSIPELTGWKQTPSFSGNPKMQLFSLTLLDRSALPPELVQEQIMTKGEGNSKNRTAKPETENRNIKALKQAFNKALYENKLIPGETEKFPENVLTIGTEEYTEVSLGNIKSIAQNPEDPEYYLSGNSDKYLRVWNTNHFLTTGKYEYKLGPLDSSCKHAAFSKDGRFALASDYSGKLYIYDWKKMKLLKKFKPHSSRVLSFAVSEQNMYLYIAGYDKTVKVFDINSLLNNQTSPVNEYKVPYRISDLKYHDRTNTLYGTAGSHILVVTQQTVNSYKVSRSTIKDFALSVNGKSLVFSDKSGYVKLFDIEKKEITAQIKVPRAGAVEFDPCGDYIYIADMDRKINIWSIKSRKILKKKLRSPRSITELLYDKNKGMLTAGTYSWNYHKSNLGLIDVGVPLKIPQNAFYIYKKIKQYSNDTEYMKGQLYIALAEQVQETINPFLFGADLKPEPETIKIAGRYADYAIKLFPNQQILNRRLISSKLFLDAAYILETNQKQRAKEGIAYCDSIYKMNPEAIYSLNMAAELYKMANLLNESKNKTMQAIKIRPQWSEPKANLGKTFVLEGDLKNSIGQFNEIVKVRPEISKGYTNLAVVYTQKKEFKKAEQEFKKALECDTKNPFIYVKYSEMEINRKNYDKAQDLLRQAKSFAPDYYLIALTRAELRLKQMDFTAAAKNYKRALQKDPKSADTYAQFALFEIQRANFTKAKTLSDTALSIDPNCAKAYLALGTTHAYFYNNVQTNSESLEEALENFEKALDLEPYNPENNAAVAKQLLLLAESSQQSYLKDRAFEYAQKARKLNPYGDEINILNISLNKSGNTIAEALVNEAQKQQNNKLYYLYAAKAYIKAGDAGKAEDILKQICKEEPNFIQAQLELLKLYSKTNPRKAKKQGKYLLKHFPKNSAIYFELYKAASSPKKARSFLNSAKQYDSDYYMPKFAYQNLYYLKNGHHSSFTDTEFGIKRLSISKKGNILVERNSKYGILRPSGEFILKIDYDLKTDLKSKKIILEANGQTHTFLRK